jgi:hypothetical protein
MESPEEREFNLNPQGKPIIFFFLKETKHGGARIREFPVQERYQSFLEILR